VGADLGDVPSQPAQQQEGTGIPSHLAGAASTTSATVNTSSPTGVTPADVVPRRRGPVYPTDWSAA
jgi:hypothetical protein